MSECLGIFSTIAANHRKRNFSFSETSLRRLTDLLGCRCPPHYHNAPLHCPVLYDLGHHNQAIHMVFIMISIFVVAGDFNVKALEWGYRCQRKIHS
ncbi:hypothetical protein J6590_058517 [Homalodisca vitripennis]|nr:hypothetical protein J6590_058517 [Homalodisca vitripennis]